MEAVANSTWFVPVIAVIMALGLFSLLTYIVPGLTIIWIAALVYGIVKGFTVSTGIIFGVITLLMLGGNIVDNLTMGASAKKTGASWLSIAVALVAGVAGTFLLPPFGGILFAAVGILVVEWIRNKNLEAGLRSTGGILKGCGLGVILRFGIGVIMIGLWVLWVVLAR
jgi:hypothetical protein